MLSRICFPLLMVLMFLTGCGHDRPSGWYFSWTAELQPFVEVEEGSFYIPGRIGMTEVQQGDHQVTLFWNEYRNGVRAGVQLYYYEGDRQWVAAPIACNIGEGGDVECRPSTDGDNMVVIENVKVLTFIGQEKPEDPSEECDCCT